MKGLEEEQDRINKETKSKVEKLNILRNKKIKDLEYIKLFLLKHLYSKYNNYV
ncbi:MAG: hypothetical protein JETCAE03_21560 [Ignavibacteriaceae bacterium]|nr:MAG: hypothetical protein JETCAE03_21560 [Ignavibacteriaceae bacterium]